MKRIETTITFLSRLNNTEHDYLHRNCSLSLTENAVSITLISATRIRYQQFYEQEDAMFKHSQKMVETKSLEELDKLRDTNFSDLKTIVDLSTRNKNAGIKEAAEMIGFVIERYKMASQKAYAENTDLIINMLQDLSADQYTSAIDTLQIAELIDTLQENNDAFDRLYKERAIRQYELNENGKLVEIRKQVDLEFLELIDQINSIYKTVKMVGTDAELIAKFELIIKEISSFIEQAERVYYSRVNRAKPDKKPDPSKPDDPDHPDNEPYFFEVATQTLERGDMIITDKNPEVFHVRFADFSFEGCFLSYDLPPDPTDPDDEGELDETPFYFGDYTYDEENKPIGFKLVSSSTAIDISGPPVNYAVMSREGEIFVRFDAYIEPTFID